LEVVIKKSKTKKVIGKKDLGRVIAEVLYRSMHHAENGFDDIAALSADLVDMNICMKTFQDHLDKRCNEHKETK